MVVGRILERCAREMRRRLGRLTPAEYFRRHGPLVIESEYERPAGMTWDDDAYRGDAYGAYGWGCNVAEVEIDPDTCEVRPARFTAVIDVGKAIHPGSSRGQIEGGTVAGHRLRADREGRDEGRPHGERAAHELRRSRRRSTSPPIDVGILEVPYAHGPAGAKGVGEMPIDGPAPAIVNAIRHAGLDVREAPATPEILLRVRGGVGLGADALHAEREEGRRRRRRR